MVLADRRMASLLAICVRQGKKDLQCLAWFGIDLNILLPFHAGLELQLLAGFSVRYFLSAQGFAETLSAAFTSARSNLRPRSFFPAR